MKLNREAHASQVQGFENFLWPVWRENRSTVTARRAWRCVKCLQCFYHRQQVRKHRCSGDSSHLDPEVRKKRLQALDLLKPLAPQAGYEPKDFECIVSRCCNALLGEPLLPSLE